MHAHQEKIKLNNTHAVDEKNDSLAKEIKEKEVIQHNLTNFYQHIHPEENWSGDMNWVYAQIQGKLNIVNKAIEIAKTTSSNICYDAIHLKSEEKIKENIHYDKLLFAPQGIPAVWKLLSIYEKDMKQTKEKILLIKKLISICTTYQQEIDNDLHLIKDSIKIMSIHKI